MSEMLLIMCKRCNESVLAENWPVEHKLSWMLTHLVKKHGIEVLPPWIKREGCTIVCHKCESQITILGDFMGLAGIAWIVSHYHGDLSILRDHFEIIKLPESPLDLRRDK